MKTILVTGAAGFIGFHLSKILLEHNYRVVGLDNINAYYSKQLKYDRLRELGIDASSISYNTIIGSSKSIIYKNFEFVLLNLEDRENLPDLFEHYEFDIVCNLAAQAGVRYSLENPNAYIDSNIVGFSNILECCRNFNVKKILYASSSSVYGMNSKVPFSVEDRVDNPISLYAATKKSNELMAYSYSHLYDIETIGLRFFTVYGPWGRPDMAMHLFTDAILNDQPIKVFNDGDLERDFTYVDDITNGLLEVIRDDNSNTSNYKLYNIGNSKPVKLMDFINEIENVTSKKAEKQFLEMQPGDVSKTWADTAGLEKDYKYVSKTDISTGIKSFVNWYRDYYKV